jgi:ATP-binding cassette, subfamily C, bacterial CydC
VKTFRIACDEEIEQAMKTVDLTSWYLFNSLMDWTVGWVKMEKSLVVDNGKSLLLAQALLKKPQFLVVDEPTAGISSENAIAIFRNIKHQYPDITILMATHLKNFEPEVDTVARI